jgi:hypothetical protein
MVATIFVPVFLGRIYPATKSSSNQTFRYIVAIDLEKYGNLGLKSSLAICLI